MIGLQSITSWVAFTRSTWYIWPGTYVYNPSSCYCLVSNIRLLYWLCFVVTLTLSLFDHYLFDPVWPVWLFDPHHVFLWPLPLCDLHFVFVWPLPCLCLSLVFLWLLPCLCVTFTLSLFDPYLVFGWHLPCLCMTFTLSLCDQYLLFVLPLQMLSFLYLPGDSRF